MKQRDPENGFNVQKKRNTRTVARFNAKMMERLQKAFEEDASVDLSTIIPDNYQSRRHNIRQEEQEEQEEQECFPADSTTGNQLSSAVVQDPCSSSPVKDLDLPHNPAEIVFSLSAVAVDALQLQEERLTDGEHVATRLKSALMRGEVLCSPKHHTHLIRCDNDLVVKCFTPESTANGMDFTEFTSLQYLARDIPNIPAPRPHGLITSGSMAYLLMTHIPGQTLESLWPLLTSQQKSNLQNELQDILVQLRGHLKPNTLKLGGVQGEGCKDTRRATKISSKPLRSPTDFWNFVYGTPMGPTPTYTQTIRSMFPFESSEECVFTHGDLRPANIHVTRNDGQYHIAGILDWEMSGFYPESWESCKITNCISPIDTWDWYLYTPPCVSPARYSYRWLLDRFWDRYIVSQSGIIEVD